MNTTILLLVSDPIVHSIVTETLEHEGYTVVAAGDLSRRLTGSRRPSGSTDNPNLPCALVGHDTTMYLRNLRTKCLKMKVLILGAFFMTGVFNLAKLCKDLKSSDDRFVSRPIGTGRLCRRHRGFFGRPWPDGRRRSGCTLSAPLSHCSHLNPGNELGFGIRRAVRSRLPYSETRRDFDVGLPLPKTARRL